MKGNINERFWSNYPNYKYIIVVLTLLTCCTNEKSKLTSEQPIPIDINTSCDSIDSDPYIHNFLYSAVKVQSEDPIASVKSVCFLQDSLCYILDTSNALICIDINNGRVLKYKRKVGRAKDEVIMPNSIMADDEYVYVWDGGKSCIIVYDCQMEYQFTIPLHDVLDDFVKTKDGLLLYSSGEESAATLIDADGKEIYSRQFSTDDDAQEGARYHFTKDENDDVYLMTTYSDTIYRWNGQKLMAAYYINYGDNDDERRHTLWYFVCGGRIVFSYLNNKKVEYGSYDIQTGTVAVGFPQSKDGIYFFPQYQNGRMLVTIVDGDLLSSVLDMSQEENKDVKLLFWKYM